jgi:hypothetical protein
MCRRKRGLGVPLDSPCACRLALENALGAVLRQANSMY